MAAHGWDEVIRTGVESIDAEHRLQVTLVDNLGELVRAGRGRAPAERTMRQLADFTRVHFLSEELMMRLYSYPRHDEHKAEHARLEGELDELQRRVVADDAAVALGAIERLRGWLVGHIRTLDVAFASWCARNDVHAR